MREAFEAMKPSEELEELMRHGMTQELCDEIEAAFRDANSQAAHARAEMGARDHEIRRILATAPDLNLKDYSKGQVEKLVRAMQQAYALVSDELPSLRGNERATLAEPQPTGAGE